MRRSERNEWVADLRSGLFPQYTGGMLRATLETGEDGFCCLGVKLERDARTGRHNIVRVDDGYFDESEVDPEICDGMPSSAMLTAWGLSEADARQLASMNDGDSDSEIGPASFAEIADWIEANVPVSDD